VTTPPIVRTVSDLRARVAAWRAEGERVALAPTMGALHAGHLSLIERARTHASRIVASVFVNPTQFGPAEDFAAYPRDEAADAAMLGAAGCDLMYAPSTETIYPAGFATRITMEGLTDGMEGAARPGHFTGVATVVAKLLIQAGPDVAIFGEKDFQQLAVIRRLVADLDLPVEILAGPIVRADDGLALSSRNAYLTPEQRLVAPALYRVMTAAAIAMVGGQAVEVAEQAAAAALKTAGFEAVDYVETRDPNSLARLGSGPLVSPARLLAVARLGRTRLLDNIAIGL
jgi:pantoate--beta-alanine ligase